MDVLDSLDAFHHRHWRWWRNKVEWDKLEPTPEDIGALLVLGEFEFLYELNARGLWSPNENEGKRIENYARKHGLIVA